ncbi:hypothetical protein MMR14E_18620 [Methylobacterium mesophilicum]
MRERDRVRDAASPRKSRPRLNGDGALDPDPSRPSPRPSPARERGSVAPRLRRPSPWPDSWPDPCPRGTRDLSSPRPAQCTRATARPAMPNGPSCLAERRDPGAYPISR